MGVPGLWHLLEPARRPIELDQLSGRTIAIDMNIWLHQAVKSRASSGGPRAYLTVLFRRLCKLLFFGIRPVFVFDGDVPALKKATMAVRRRLRHNLSDRASEAQQRILRRLLKRVAESTVCSSTSSPDKSNKTAKAELLRRLGHHPEVQQAKEDEALFSAPNEPSSEELNAGGLLHERAGLEFDDLARDYLDGIKLHVNADELDLNSTSFCALPLQAQLRVVQLAREQLDSQFRSGLVQDTEQSLCGETFSMNQVNRLLLRRRLAERQKELSLQLAREEAARQVVTLNNPHFMETLRARLEQFRSAGVEDSTTTAMRIQSRDTGHAILIKKSPMKAPAGTKMSDSVFPLENLIIQPNALSKELESVPPEDEIKTEVNDQPLSPKTTPESNGSSILETVPTASKMNHAITTTEPVEQIDVIDLTPRPPSPSPRKAGGISQSSLPVYSVSPSLSSSPRDHLIAEAPNEVLCTSKLTDNSSGSTNLDTIPSLVDANTTVPCDVLATSTQVNDELEDEDDDEFLEVPMSTTAPEVPPPESLNDSHSSSSAEEEEDEASGGMESQQLTQIDTQQPVYQSQWTEDEDVSVLDDDVLREQADRFARQAQTTTTRCIEEAQALLQLFGIPFIVSPEEAEAQCVALQQSGLVDLVASDDSDVWPFGARSVCRHLFSGGEAKSVTTKRAPRAPSQYTLEDVQRTVGLNMANILRLTLLCGSDYTPGVQNVGPVTAVEILSEFGEINDEANVEWNALLEANAASDLLAIKVVEPLERFTTWYRTAFAATEGTSNPLNTSPVRKKWLKFCPPEGFPDPRIVKAYLRPKVIPQPGSFSWDAPNVEELVKYAQSAFGWHPVQTESMLRAVLNRQQKRSIGDPLNSRITDFFRPADLNPLSSTVPSVESPDEVTLPSKRARKAVSRLVKKVQANNSEDILVESTDRTKCDEPMDFPYAQSSRRKRKTSSAESTSKTTTKQRKQTGKVVQQTTAKRRVVSRVALSEDEDNDN